MTVEPSLVAENGSSPSPRGAHLEMVGAVLAGQGLRRVAEIAAAHAGAPVAVVVPRLAPDAVRGEPLERYVAARLAGDESVAAPADVAAEVPIASGGQRVGSVLMLGDGLPEAGEYLHMAAVAALTEVAVVEARDEAEQSVRGSLLEELLRGDAIDPEALVRRARRLGSDLSRGGVALCADPGERSAGRVLAVVADERPDAIAEAIGARVYALVPGPADGARELAARVGRQAVVGVSSAYSGPAHMRRALEEAELVLDVTADGRATCEEVGEGTYRLLFRVLASHPEEVRSFYEDTVAELVAYDEQYSTDLVGTLESYLAENCNMNATAAAIHAHRHTVGYRLERIRELTGLDPSTSEDRERLGLGLKAYRIIGPKLPR